MSLHLDVLADGISTLTTVQEVTSMTTTSAPGCARAVPTRSSTLVKTGAVAAAALDGRGGY